MGKEAQEAGPRTAPSVPPAALRRGCDRRWSPPGDLAVGNSGVSVLDSMPRLWRQGGWGCRDKELPPPALWSLPEALLVPQPKPLGSVVTGAPQTHQATPYF